MEILDLPLVSIQILNWNRSLETLRAIESAKNQTYKNIEIVVIDNGSTDNSVDDIKRKYPDLLVVELDRNYGCPGGRNRGIKHCSGKYIFYLDNDGVLESQAVENAVRLIKLDDSIKIITGIVYPFTNESEIINCLNLQSVNTYTITRSFQGGICMHDKTLYDLVGNYPDSYIYGGEENNISLKIHAKGYKIIQSNSIVLWHEKSNKARNYVSEFVLSLTNRLLTVYELYPLPLLLLFFLKFISYYTYYAYKSGHGKEFLKSTIFGLKCRIKEIQRKPVKLKYVVSYHKLPMYSSY